MGVAIAQLHSCRPAGRSTVFTVTALLALAMIAVLCVPVSTAGALVIARSVPNNGSTFAFYSTLGFPGDNGEIRMIPEHALCMH